MRFHAPSLTGSTLTARVADGDLEEFVRVLRERVEAANTCYERNVLPRKQEAAEARERSQVELDKRLDDAQRKLNELF